MIELPKATHATLPEGLDGTRDEIASMDVGQSGWTVPWAMLVDRERKCWLRGDYPVIYSDMEGTSNMRVWRDEGGWHVDASRCKHRWDIGAGPPMQAWRPIRVATFTG